MGIAIELFHVNISDSHDVEELGHEQWQESPASYRNRCKVRAERSQLAAEVAEVEEEEEEEEERRLVREVRGLGLHRTLVWVLRVRGRGSLRGGLGRGGSVLRRAC